MKQRELARLHVLNNVLEFRIPIAQAAEILGVSERHTRRLLTAYHRDGAAALAHGNRGRRPHNAIPESQAAAVVQLAGTHYAGTIHTHLTELLQEHDGIDLSRPTVRRILANAGIGSPRSSRPHSNRVRRRRMPQEGMLLQIDGSHHHWFGEKGPKFTLLLTVDDATGTEAGRTESTVTVSDGALTSSFTVTRNISEQATDLGDGSNFDERHSSTYTTAAKPTTTRSASAKPGRSHLASAASPSTWTYIWKTARATLYLNPPTAPLSKYGSKQRWGPVPNSSESTQRKPEPLSTTSAGATNRTNNVLEPVVPAKALPNAPG